MVVTYDHIRQPMRLIEAETWVIAKLGATPRARHSRFVGALMRKVAERVAPEDAELWEVTGLLHDLDYPICEGDWHMHGRITVAWLEGRLPVPALQAIAAHDHRSGIVADGPMAHALKLCDALAVLDEGAGRTATLAAFASGEPALRELAGERAYLAGMIIELSTGLDLQLAALTEILAALPEQMAG